MRLNRRYYHAEMGGEGGGAGGSGGGEGGSEGGDLSQTQTTGAEGGSGGGDDGGSLIDAIRKSIGLDETKTGADDKTLDDPTKQQKQGQGDPNQQQPGKKKAGADPDFQPPVGVTPETQARFTKLVERVKSAEGEAAKYREFKPQYDAMAADVTEIRGMLSEARIEDPQQFTNLIQYAKLYNTGDLRGARDMLIQQLRDVSLQLGEDAPDLNPLAEFDDLRQEVEDGYITRQRALQLANARRKEQQEQERQQSQQQQQQSQQQDSQQRGAAEKAVVDWIAELRANDIDFVAKGPMLEEMVEEICNEYPPNLWLTTFKRQYKLLGGSGASSVQGRRQQQGGAGGQQQQRRTPSPLRPGAGGNMKQEPSNLFDAVRISVNGGVTEG